MKLSMDSLKLGPRENAVAEIAWFVLGVVSFDEPRYGNSSKCRRQSTWWLLLERLRRKKLPRLDVLQGCCYLGAEVKLMKVIQKVYLKSSNKTLQLQANYYSKEVLEVKPPTIWTEGKAEVGRVREEKRREKKKEDQRRERVRGKKMQAREKVEKSRFTVFFLMVCGSGGSKSRLAKAAGAEPFGQMRDDKLEVFGKS